MRTFGTQGPVNLKENYVVSRTEEIADFVDRVKKGKYIVLFAPRQTGKTTLFRAAMDTLIADAYFPIQLNFELYVDCFERILNNIISDKTSNHFHPNPRHEPRILSFTKRWVIDTFARKIVNRFSAAFIRNMDSASVIALTK